jgi:two-component system sensor histidine kinase KdpD
MKIRLFTLTQSSSKLTTVLKTAAGMLVVALITWLCFGIDRLLIPGLLYLIVVVLESLWGGFLCAAVVSVFAPALLEYFFIPPVLQWQIDDPDDFLAFVVYLATGLIITRLASAAKSEAQAAERGRRDASMLYDAASRLLTLSPDKAAGPEALRVFCEVFGLRAACLVEEASGRLQLEGGSLHDLGTLTRSACTEGRDYTDPERQLFIRCLRAEGRVTGAAGFEGRIEYDSVAPALAALGATSLERLRSFRSASKAAADAQAEMLRSAILDAFAHEFKTPLAIILAAAGTLRETGGEDSDRHAEMTDMIEDQTMRLNQLTTRLLRIARLDREDVSPTMEPVSLTVLLGDLVAKHRAQFGRGIELRLPEADCRMLADSELLNLALTQLLDNACKYSAPSSPVSVEVQISGGCAEIRVSNTGTSITPEEQERIFERFYRGVETEAITPGAGLGLYVARKIVRAHGGSLDLLRDESLHEPGAATTTFRITLPLASPEHERHEQQTCQSVGSGR